MDSERRVFILGLLLATVWTIGCSGDRSGRATQNADRSKTEAAWFVDQAAASGLDFVHFNGMTGRFTQPEMMGPGVALFDYDNDGDLDVFLAQGQMLGPGDGSQALIPPSGPMPLEGRLYRNDLVVNADGTRSVHFTDVTEASGIVARGYGMGVAAADIDNDGCIDLYVTNFGRNQLFRNNCNGTFSDISKSSGTDEPGWSVSAAFVDYDRDGWLDLFVCRYLDVDLATDKPCFNAAGARDYCFPDAFRAQPSRLFHNNRNGTFTDVSERAGIASTFGPALGVVSADFDGDGWPDLYVANDTHENQLWINQHNGTFKNTALLAGAALPIHGRPEASMGLDAGDFDNDGDDDLIMMELNGQGANLFVNDGTGVFDDQSARSGLEAATLAYTGFGAAWLDFDNDGWLDVLIANGTVQAIEPQAREHKPLPLQQKMQLLRNRGNGRLEDVSSQAGPAFETPIVGRGAAFGDIDNDGDTDVIVAVNSGPPLLLVNTVGNRKHWIGLRLVGGKGARDMLGARVDMTTSNGRRLMRRARSDGSYASVNDPRVLAGLDDAAGPVEVHVRWPDDRQETWTGVPADRYTTLTEGSAPAR